MKLLVLGGTRFVGRHLVEAALAKQHEVTLFNRGITNPGLFPEIETLIGDRDGGLKVLAGRQWDAVIDVNGYIPRLVRDAAQFLSQVVQQYVFISTLAVFADKTALRQDEDAPLDTLDDALVEAVTPETYGPLKALCELAVLESVPHRALILRPGYVVGPYDSTDRFTYWVRRVGQGGEMLAPGQPERPMQFVDGRDLADFTLRCVEARQISIYNVTGPAQPFTWGEFLHETASILGADTTFTWVSETFLNSQDVTGMELPMWTPANARGIMTFDCCRALGAGLRFRSLSETVIDTLGWDAAHGQPQAGLAPDREMKLLQAWKAGTAP